MTPFAKLCLKLLDEGEITLEDVPVWAYSEILEHQDKQEGGKTSYES